MANQQKRLDLEHSDIQKVEGGVVRYRGNVRYQGEAMEAFSFWPISDWFSDHTLEEVGDPQMALENERQMRDLARGGKTD